MGRSEQSADVVGSTTRDGVATIVLNRPDQRNALSSELLRLLRAELVAADAAPDVDVIVLTGADPAFSAGFDLAELGAADGAAAADERGPRLQGPFPDVAKPVIGAINGPAVAGGFELALACDFLVASERAFFADTHARLGLHPGWGLTVLLPGAIGLRRAREVSMTGRQIDPATALSWGLVNHVVPHGDLLHRCAEIAAAIRTNNQRAVRRLGATYDAIHAEGTNTAWEIEQRAVRDSLRRSRPDPDRPASPGRSPTRP